MSARHNRRAFALGSFARNGLIGARVGVGVGVAGRGTPGVAGADDGGVIGAPLGTEATGLVILGGGSGGIGGMAIGGRADAPGRAPVAGGVNGLLRPALGLPPPTIGGTIGRGILVEARGAPAAGVGGAED